MDLTRRRAGVLAWLMIEVLACVAEVRDAINHRRVINLLTAFVGAGLASAAAHAAPTPFITWEYDQIRPAVAYDEQANAFLAVWEDHHCLRAPFAVATSNQQETQWEDEP